ncbi:Leucine-rich repeat-containing protein 3, partial [Stylophora pistillata]
MFFIIVAIITEVYSWEYIEDFGTTKLLQVEKGQYVEIGFRIYILSSLSGAPCADEEYLEIRDGYNQSANLLGVFCGRYTSYFTLRSSGHNMWLRFSPHHRYKLGNASFEGKALNAKVATNLVKVEKTQFVLLNHSSSLWCPARGGPAPRIVWRRNGAVVQNSTSVRLQINVTEEERNTKYSCEVDDHGQLKRENISLAVETECPQPCQCKVLKGKMKGLVSANCEGKQLKSIPKKIPRATGKLDLSNNKLLNLSVGAFSDNTKLEHLDLSNNQLQYLPPGAFADIEVSPWEDLTL